jgi:hypothetical protein
MNLNWFIGISIGIISIGIIIGLRIGLTLLRLGFVVYALQIESENGKCKTTMLLNITLTYLK